MPHAGFDRSSPVNATSKVGAEWSGRPNVLPAASLASVAEALLGPAKLSATPRPLLPPRSLAPARPWPGAADPPVAAVKSAAKSAAKNAASAASAGRPRVLLLANRIGELNGETGGGSLFRQKLHDGLQDSAFQVSTLSAGRADVEHTETVRGPLMRATLRNLATVFLEVSRQDLVVISGSWSFLTAFAVYCGLLLGVPCVTFVTMNSSAAVDSCFRGALWCLASVLYLLTDLCNCWFSVAAYTRSEEYCRTLRARGLPVRGVVFFSDQYDAFRAADAPEAVAAARRTLSAEQPERPLLLYCGRLLQEKRIPLLISSKPREAVLAIVGGGAAAETLQRFHNPAEGVVCHFGKMVPQSQLRVFYKAADIHVSASNFETLGNTVHEALLCGCPAVVQDAGGYVSQVANGQNGFLVDWEDPVATGIALARVLRGELKAVAPLERNVVDAMEAVRAHAGRSRPYACTAIGLACFPVVLLLWALARVYEQLVQSPTGDKLPMPSSSCDHQGRRSAP